MAVQQYELSIIFRAALLTAESEYPVTSPVVNTTSAQPQPPIIVESNEGVFVQMCMFFRKRTTGRGKCFCLKESKRDREDED